MPTRKAAASIDVQKAPPQVIAAIQALSPTELEQFTAILKVVPKLPHDTQWDESTIKQLAIDHPVLESMTAAGAQKMISAIKANQEHGTPGNKHV